MLDENIKKLEAILSPEFYEEDLLNARNSVGIRAEQFAVNISMTIF